MRAWLVLIKALPQSANVDTDTVSQLVLIHSRLLEGLQVRLLADPDLLSHEDAGALIERTMNAVGALLERANDLLRTPGSAAGVQSSEAADRARPCQWCDRDHGKGQLRGDP